MAAYRQKMMIRDNAPGGSDRLVFRVAIGATGAVGVVRPSAGATAANGAGNLATVSRVATGVYRVALTETYYKTLGIASHLLSPYDVTGASSQAVFCQGSVIDATTNSYLIYTMNTSNTLVDPASGSQLVIEVRMINVVSPTTL